jgi:hypothetical protein
MATIYDTILKISTDENDLRKQENLITNNMAYCVNTEDLRHVKGIPQSKIVLRGSQNRDTINNHEFNMEFSKKTYDLLTYVSWDNLVVAGGALVNIITGSTEKLNDVDLFIYGLNKKDATEKIDRVISCIKQKATDMKYDTRVYLNKNVINVYVFDVKKLLQIQIILRLYDSITKIIMGFDVDCCAIAFNGRDILTTTRGAYGFKYRVNVANLQRRSPSYENRLIKYSFRGFDVVTDFTYENQYNKLFFMASDSVGFTRLLEQELVNNGQLKNIIFGNTLRFRKTASYAKGGSWYQKDHLEITNVTHTENCITKYNANIEDDFMKFREYSVKYIDMMVNNVMDQLTGSFSPITDQEWIKTSNDNADPLGRSRLFLDLKYNRYKKVTDFDDVDISDMSNFDTKCLAVIYVENDDDVVKIIDSKYVKTSTNMYKINYVQLAILLGRTKLAVKLMKGSCYEKYKELIYMMDNDKLFTNYCNAVGKSCIDIDKTLVNKFGCINISDNIHNQTKVNNKFAILYDQSFSEQLMTLGVSRDPHEYYCVDITRLSYSAIKLLYERNGIPSDNLHKYIVKTINRDEFNNIHKLLDADEIPILEFVAKCFEKTESLKDKKTSDNIKKLLVVKGLWKDDIGCTSCYGEYNKISGNLYMCMKLIYSGYLNMENIKKLIGSDKAYDIIVRYAIYLDDVKLIKKLISEEDVYVRLKYRYTIEDGTNIKKFFDEIDKKRQEDKKKINEYLKNTACHVDALNDGNLPEGYERCENVFGMTPDDNIVAKLLLMFNKVFNKNDVLNDKDKTTLCNMRRTVANIKRNNEFNRVDKSYFYSLDLHKLFFGNKNETRNYTDSSEDHAPTNNLHVNEILCNMPTPYVQKIVTITKSDVTDNLYGSQSDSDDATNDLSGSQSVSDEDAECSYSRDSSSF